MNVSTGKRTVDGKLAGRVKAVTTAATEFCAATRPNGPMQAIKAACHALAATPHDISIVDAFIMAIKKAGSVKHGAPRGCSKLRQMIRLRSVQQSAAEVVCAIIREQWQQLVEVTNDQCRRLEEHLGELWRESAERLLEECRPPHAHHADDGQSWLSAAALGAVGSHRVPVESAADDVQAALLGEIEAGIESCFNTNKDMLEATYLVRGA